MQQPCRHKLGTAAPAVYAAPTTHLRPPPPQQCVASTNPCKHSSPSQDPCKQCTSPQIQTHQQQQQHRSPPQRAPPPRKECAARSFYCLTSAAMTFSTAGICRRNARATHAVSPGPLGCGRNTRFLPAAPARLQQLLREAHFTQAMSFRLRAGSSSGDRRASSEAVDAVCGRARIMHRTQRIRWKAQST